MIGIEFAFQSVCYEGHLSVVQLLLRHGVDPNVDYVLLKPPKKSLFLTAQKGHAKVVGCLIDNNAVVGEESLLEACNNDHLETLKLLAPAFWRAVQHRVKRPSTPTLEAHENLQRRKA
eukprot:scaffold7995_cov173-Amphora_coffeaeformis.AAC.3